LERVSRLLILSGAPATLRADVAVPPGGSASLFTKLLEDFAFLSADNRAREPAGQLPSASLPG